MQYRALEPRPAALYVIVVPGQTLEITVPIENVSLGGWSYLALVQIGKFLNGSFSIEEDAQGWDNFKPGEKRMLSLSFPIDIPPYQYGLKDVRAGIYWGRVGTQPTISAATLIAGPISERATIYIGATGEVP